MRNPSLKLYLNLLLTLAIIAPLSYAAPSAQPETADEVRARRAQRQLEKNKRKQERDAQSRTPEELGEMPEIDPALTDQYTEILDIIADPSMEGRVPGSRGIEEAATYIEDFVAALGLTPAFPETETVETETAQDDTQVSTPFTTFRQPIQMGSHTAAATQSLAIGNHTFTPDIDFSPLAYSGSATISAPIAFVGYAIVSGPNHYLGFETTESIQGKVALCLNYEPMDDQGNSLWREGDWSHNSRLTYKVSALERRGAAAVIIVSPPKANDDRTFILESIESTSPPSNKVGERTGPQYDIPVIHVTAEVANALLIHTNDSANTDYTLDSLTAQANQAGIVLPLGDLPVDLDIQLERTPRFTSNIGAILPGQGALKDEYVVIGSHYDHVGYGKFGSRTPHRKGEVHPGADDNGSGTTANMIAAQTLTQRYQLLAENQSARSILFLWFTAEESGLNGSRHYVQNPVTDLDNHVIMLNMDMVGTLDDQLLEIGGFNSAKGFQDFATPILKSAAIPYSEDVSVGEGRSDHASFDAVGIPNLFFFTGLHDQYHSPDDTTEIVDNEGAVRISLLVSDMAFEAATQQARLSDPSKNKETSKKEGPNVRVGIIPSNTSKGGMKVERVFEDTSASAAGIQPGDRITQWGDTQINSVEEWMPLLTANEPGDVITITVIRDDQTIELEMTLRPIE
mgnify:CR=1 FL=1